MPPQVRAILWAQWRSMLNFRPGDRGVGRYIGLFIGLIWYGVWCGAAIAAAAFLSDPAHTPTFPTTLPLLFMLAFVYWQAAPIMTASMGAALELKRLLVYPIPERSLFRIEVLLRLATGMEMLIVLAGVTAGLLANPTARHPAVLLVLPAYSLFNLFIAAGMRNLIDRMMRYKRIREAAVFLLVLAAGLPQLIAIAGVPPALRQFGSGFSSDFLPWTAAARLAVGGKMFAPAAVLTSWILIAYVFGRWQFRRSLSFDAAAAAAMRSPQNAKSSWIASIYTFPARLLPDPLSALVEKELRSLARTPRFRLVFLMGFSFGFLIWIPMLTKGGDSWKSAENVAVFVSVYSLLLVAEVLFWNVFGFDRAAVQVYLSAPVALSKVLAGKNYAALLAMMMEVSIILAVCALMRLPLSGATVLEAYSVILVLCVYMISIGNLSSIYSPRPLNPEQTWGRRTAGKYQFVMLLVMPVVATPIALAYLARYAFESDIAFYAVLTCAALVGGVFYSVALDTALNLAGRRVEQITAALSQSGGPIGSE